MRPIDADALIETVKNEKYDCYEEWDAIDRTINLIKHAPTIDAVSVVHGEWKPFDQAWGRQIWYCTACETSMHMPTKMGKPMYEYCPYCGAKMKGADDE